MASTVKGKGPKCNSPEPYKGEFGEKLETFISQCVMYLMIQAGQFESDAQRVAWAMTYLQGDAASWATSHMSTFGTATQSPVFALWEVFLEKLRGVFGDKDRRRAQANRLQTIKQVTSVASYIAKFNKASEGTGYGVTELMDRFELNLKTDIRKELAKKEPFRRLEDLQEWCANYDQKIFQIRQQERQETQGQGPKKPPFQQRFKGDNRVQQVKAAVSKPRGKLTPEERQRRFKEGLCLYCGEKGHMAKDHKNSKLAALSTDTPDSKAMPGEESDLESEN